VGSFCSLEDRGAHGRWGRKKNPKTKQVYGGGKKMKSIFAFILAMAVFVLFILTIANAAPFLACDLPEAGVVITQTKVEVT